MGNKRDTDEDNDVQECIRTLNVVIQKGTIDAKLKALVAIQEVLEPEDETYSGNRELVEGGIQPLLLQVLADGSAEVRAAGARTLELLSQQSPAVLARLADAHTLGNFNPVQETLGDRDIIRLLVEDVVREGGPSSAARQALAALASFNRPNKLAILDEFMARVLAGNFQAVEEIDTLVTGMEMKDDVAVILDQAVLPLISMMRAGKGHPQAQAAALLATIMEQRPGLSDFIRNKGGLEAAAHLLKTGTLPTSDVAAHTLWLLVKNARNGFAGMLGFPASDLVKPLVHLIEAGHKYAKSVAEAEEEGERARGPEVLYDDDAALLLKALASQDPDVRLHLKATHLDSNSSCCIS